MNDELVLMNGELEVLNSMNPDGLIGVVLGIEKEADKLNEQKKLLDNRAKVIRGIILDKMKSLGLTSATHESGYRATIRVTEKISYSDQAVVIKSLKKNKLDLFITKIPKQVIPEHEDINYIQFEGWLKTGTESQKSLVDGIEIDKKEALVIAKK